MSDWKRRYEEQKRFLDISMELTDELQAQNKKLIEALEACYNIDAKYIDQTTSVTYKEYYCDIIDILEVTLAEIKTHQKENGDVKRTIKVRKRST